MPRSVFLLAFALVAVATAGVAQRVANRAVYLDDQGVVRWRDDRGEVTLFGANYVLPTASDYRAAGYLYADRKKMIDEDMAQLARMGWDGLRLTFWGDWEASDSAGNLIANDHLDLLDYLIARARERGIYMLFSPIQLYGSNWPDALQDTTQPGFGRRYGKARMGTDPKTSVLNPYCQSHDVKNLFVTDASCFVSLPGTHGITTWIMALAMRASEYLADGMKKGEIA